MVFIRRPDLGTVNPDHHRWQVTHVRELYAIFFLPLSEPLSLPNEYPLRSYIPIEIGLIQELRECDWYLELADFDEDAPGAESPADQEATNWSNKTIMSSSLLFHNVGGDFFARSGLDTAVLAAKTATQHGVTPEQIRGLSVLHWTRDERDRDISGMEGIGRVTVVEASVPLRVLGEPKLLGELDVPLASLSERRPLPPADWQTIDLNADGVIDLQAIGHRINDALDAALSDLQSIIRGYFRVTRSPIRLPTRELLPPQVPMVLRQLQHFIDRKPDETPGGSEFQLIPVHRNLWSILSAPELTQEQSDNLLPARTQAAGQAFSASDDLTRQARIALERDGDTRLAALLIGTASEVLINDVILHCQWESSCTPEDAAETWPDGIDTRIKRLAAPTLGGSWDKTGEGAVARWDRTAMALRHRAVHVAYIPTHHEATEAIKAYFELLAFICDRLCVHSNLPRYPRTAIRLAGKSGLERRGAYTRRVRQLMQSADEVDWGTTFSRWRNVHTLVRRDKSGPARAPSLDASVLVLVIHAKRFVWCAWHKDAEMVARVTIDEESAAGSEFMGSIRTQLAQVAGRQITFPHSIQFEQDVVSIVSDHERWIEQYRELPLAGVMVDASDLNL